MGGSTVAQFLYDGYSQAAGQAAQTVIGTILPVVSAATIAVLHLFIVIWGKNVAFGEMGAGEFANRFVRGYLVIALMVPATFNQYITTELTQTIPDMITQAIGGQQNLQGAQGFDALLNAETNMASRIRAQLIPPLFYIGERATVWVIEWIAKIFCWVSFIIWFAAKASVFFVVPFLALLGWLYLFKATQHFVESALGMIVALFLVQAAALMVAAVVVTESSAYIQKFGNSVAVQTPNPDLKLGGDNGMLAFTGFNENIPGGGGVVAPAGGQTVNVDSAIEILGNTILVYLVGAFILGITTIVSFGIGRSSGFSATALVQNTVGRVANRVGRMARA
jgi:hypothetical protein